MGRIARVVVPGCPHHVTQRGNHQQTVFFTDSDRRMYLRLLQAHAAKHGLRLFGYCLLTNHVHLIAVPDREDSLAKGFGRTHNDYARWLQARRLTNGHLWQNRYWSCPLDDNHTWDALRYVELNPVRAALVEKAWHWEWSSARAHTCGRDESGLLDLCAWRERFGAEYWREALQAGFEDAVLVERLREATATGRPLGSSAFVDQLERRLQRSLRPGKRGPKPKAAAAGAALSFEVV